ncbi:Protein MARD1 [Linum grandiflorum]
MDSPASVRCRVHEGICSRVSCFMVLLLSDGKEASGSEFGTKTTRTVTQLVADLKDSPWLFTECLSVTEMELSEDYTCVISRKRTNPKTTHIFDNCVVENYFCLSTENSVPPVVSQVNYNIDFLSFCYTCKKSLEHKRDIFIYEAECCSTAVLYNLYNQRH